MKTILALLILSTLLPLQSVASEPLFVSCWNEQRESHLLLAFNETDKTLTYTYARGPAPFPFFSKPAAGFAFTNSYVGYKWTTIDKMEFKAQILGSNSMNPQIQTSVRLKMTLNVGAGSFTLTDVEIYHKGVERDGDDLIGHLCYVYRNP